jgi:hypothetical protein
MTMRIAALRSGPHGWSAGSQGHHPETAEAFRRLLTLAHFIAQGADHVRILFAEYGKVLLSELFP